MDEPDAMQLASGMVRIRGSDDSGNEQTIYVPTSFILETAEKLR